MADHRLYSRPFAAIYRAYVAKAERKGRTAAEVDEMLCWLCGIDAATLHKRITDDGCTVREFYDGATPNPHRLLITGTVCGVRVENVDDPLMREIRYCDKLVDELAKGRPMAKILRRP